MSKFLKGLFKFLGVLVAILLAVGVVLQIFFVNLAVVGHYGMAPTLQAGDQVVVWRGNEFDIGDIAVCPSPANPNDLIMGRVAAKSGMTIETVRGQLQIEGERPDVDWQGTMQFVDPLHDRVDAVQLGEERLASVYHRVMVREAHELVIRTTTVPDGRIFLLGDNRHHTADDSRNFGAVDPTTCLGEVVMRVLPATDPPNDLGHGALDLIR